MTETNASGNRETREAIEAARTSDLGGQTDKHTGIATALASLNVAESLQLLQLQISSTSAENRKAAEVETDKLIESNERLARSNDTHSTRMFWLTVALVFTGVVQAVAALASSLPYLKYIQNTFST